MDVLLREGRSFKPPAAFRKRAGVKSTALHAKARRNPQAFWASVAKELHWFAPWKRTLDWKPPFAKWFVGGRTNLSYNCLDRHLDGPRRNKAALVWEGEPGDARVLTYQDLHREVGRFANALKSIGVKAGDRITIYLPMVPELPIAMLACARIGAAHSVIFAGFSPDSVADRTNDAGAEVVITADGGWRRGQIVPLKANVDAAVARCPQVRKVVVLHRTGQTVTMTPGRDVWWDDFVKGAPAVCPAEPLDSEHLLYLLYTSGTTGKPKGIMHSTGGTMVQTYATTKWVFDLKEEDAFWCTADIGWVTGHSYVVYGPLANGATVVMYEGAPDWPDKDRFWAIVEKYRVTILYTAPTAIRAFMKWGEEHPKKHDLSSLRLLGTVGEPINPEAWVWYHRVIGGGRCPIVDTWWQTETGAILISPLPGVTTLKPGSATFPLPGIEAQIVDDRGKPVPKGKGGLLCITKPWPSMLRGIYKDPERYQAQYWSRFPGKYFTGDGAKWDEEGYFWLLGRVDDVIKMAGHRLSTMEIESALVDHPSVAEAAVIGRSHEIKGEAVAAFVILKSIAQPTEPLKAELKEHVSKKIGAIAKPDDVFFTAELPKTRSGKIMRRLLRDIAEGRALGDTTTLTDGGVLDGLKKQYEEKEA